jgi:adenylate kinase family enzyme
LERIVIIGCPGSGKTRLARALGDKLGLTVVHLDRLWWKQGWENVTREEFDIRLENALKLDSWIIDGNYKSTMEMRMQACDTVFFLDYSTDVCLEGISFRQGRPREDMPWIEKVGEIDEEFLTMIRNYRRDSRPDVLKLLEKYKDKNIVILKSREKADAYLETIKKPMV